MEPTEMPNRTSPISAVEACSRSRTAGVRTTHEAVPVPTTSMTVKMAARRRASAGENPVRAGAGELMHRTYASGRTRRDAPAPVTG